MPDPREDSLSRWFDVRPRALDASAASSPRAPAPETSIRSCKITPSGEISTASSCIKKLDGAIVLSDATPERVNAHVRRICTEYYEISSGTEILEVAIRLEAPMLIGIRPRKRTILLPFTRVCLGTMLFEIPVGNEDIRSIRALLGERSA